MHPEPGNPHAAENRRLFETALQAIRKIGAEATHKRGGPEKSGGCSAHYIWRVVNEAMIALTGKPYDDTFRQGSHTPMFAASLGLQSPTAPPPFDPTWPGNAEPTPAPWCDRPPAGWHCTRGAGHEGPCCAADLSGPSTWGEPKPEPAPDRHWPKRTVNFYERGSYRVFFDGIGWRVAKHWVTMNLPSLTEPEALAEADRRFMADGDEPKPTEPQYKPLRREYPGSVQWVFERQNPCAGMNQPHELPDDLHAAMPHTMNWKGTLCYSSEEEANDALRRGIEALAKKKG